MVASDKYKLIFFSPLPPLETIKAAVFATGAGTYPGAKYSHVCFQSAGQGQFLPAADANPHIGQPGVLETVEEVRLEMLCVGREVLLEAVAALKK
ncbi:MAG: hypothetical protein M1825_001741 [Sarcosagium campestre]|nr:MAG: hypothetical protein M1825_001741 [Sarcosagium campestre]